MLVVYYLQKLSGICYALWPRYDYVSYLFKEHVFLIELDSLSILGEGSGAELQDIFFHFLSKILRSYGVLGKI